MPRSPLPWLHIAEVVAAQAVERGFRRLGLTGTRWLVESDVYPDKLATRGLACVRPDSTEREETNRIILDELIRGIFRPEAVVHFQHVIERMKDEGCDAVILGCTAIPLIWTRGCSLACSRHRIAAYFPGILGPQYGCGLAADPERFFVGLAALLVPLLGMSAFGFVSFPMLLLAFLPIRIADQVLGALTFPFAAAIVDAIMGLLLHFMRSDDFSGHSALPAKPSFRSDMLGGAVAAFLVFEGMFIALRLDLIHTPWFHEIAFML